MYIFYLLFKERKFHFVFFFLHWIYRYLIHEIMFTDADLIRALKPLENTTTYQARIQEFSSEGVQISENFDKPKNGGTGRNRRVVVVPSLLQKCGLNRRSRQLFTYKFIFDGLLYNCKPLSIQTRRGHGSFDIVNVSGR